jgi:hypothetical protein
LHSALVIFVLVFDVPSIDNQLRQLPDFKTVHVLNEVHCVLQGVIIFKRVLCRGARARCHAMSVTEAARGRLF